MTTDIDATQCNKDMVAAELRARARGYHGADYMSDVMMALDEEKARYLAMYAERMNKHD